MKQRIYRSGISLLATLVLLVSIVCASSNALYRVASPATAKTISQDVPTSPSSAQLAETSELEVKTKEYASHSFLYTMARSFGFDVAEQQLKWHEWILKLEFLKSVPRYLFERAFRI